MSLKGNLISNFLGQGSTALMAVAFIPVYVQQLGLEAYGLIGFASVMLAVLMVFDLGMGPTLTREMARYAAGAHTTQSIKDLLHSVEIVAFSIAAALSAIIWMLSDWLAADWLHVSSLPLPVVAHAVALMGLVCALRVCESIFRGALYGMQRQVWCNLVSAASALLRFGGAAAVVVWISPTVEAFFMWQALASLATVAILAAATHAQLPRSSWRPVFSAAALRDVREFAGGLTLTSLLVVVLTQVDKLVLSRLLPLEQFGHYMLAVTVSGIFALLVVPISAAYFPRIIGRLTDGRPSDIASDYRRAAQLAALVLVPVATVCIALAPLVVFVWTGDMALASAVAPILQILSIGSLLNGFMHIPYMLQLAHEWSGLAARINGFAALVVVPALIWTAPRYGPVGAAFIWVCFNAFALLVSIHVMHRRIVPDEKWRWYRDAVMLPLLLTAIAGAVLKLTQPAGVLSRIEGLAWIVGAALLVSLATVLSLPECRRLLLDMLRRAARRRVVDEQARPN